MDDAFTKSASASFADADEDGVTGAAGDVDAAADDSEDDSADDAAA
jgi:hypothetical protein